MFYRYLKKLDSETLPFFVCENTKIPLTEDNLKQFA